MTDNEEYVIIDRNAEDVREGDIVVTAFGVEWLVYMVMKRALMTERESNGKTVFHMFKFYNHPVVRCKVKKGDIP